MDRYFLCDRSICFLPAFFSGTKGFRRRKHIFVDVEEILKRGFVNVPEKYI